MMARNALDMCVRPRRVEIEVQLWRSDDHAFWVGGGDRTDEAMVAKRKWRMRVLEQIANAVPVVEGAEVVGGMKVTLVYESVEKMVTYLDMDRGRLLELMDEWDAEERNALMTRKVGG